jgi:hypothetical protein
MADTYFTRTPSSTGNNQTFTFSFWMKTSAVASDQYLFDANDTGSTDFLIYLRSDYKLGVGFLSAPQQYLITNRLFRDPSAWYHIVVAVDTTQATASNRIRMYINGEEETSFSTDNRSNLPQNTNLDVNKQTQHRISGYSGGQLFDGYMAHYNFIDGTQYAASDFGETDTNGQWKPKTAPSVTYGTNGFFLKFADSGSLGADSSGNGNNWTKNGSGDQVTDTPDNVFSSILPMANTSLSNGNLKLTTSRTGYWDGTVGTIGAKSGKWYWEIVPTYSSATFRCVMGVIGNQASQTVVLNGKGVTTDPSGTLFDNYAKTTWTTSYYKDGSTDGTTTAPNSGDIINVAVDLDNNKIYFGINNTYYANDGGTDGDPSNNLNESMSGLDSTVSEYMPFFRIRSDSSIGDNIMIANFGQDSSFSGTKTAQNNSDENGYGDFYYAPPTGFLALCTKNLASQLTLPIGKGSDYMNTILYTGTGSTLSLTGVGFQPDWVWGKCRSAAQVSRLFDSSRGVLKNIISSATNAEATTANSLTSFDSDGFTLGSDDNLNFNTRTFVAWNWKANGGTTSSNTDGSITSTVQANTTAGFSIVTYTGNATAGATVGHGLGKKPDMIIAKNRSTTRDWLILHKAYEGTSAENMRFTTMAVASAGSQASSGWYRTAPTSSVFYLGNGSAGDYSGDTNLSGSSMVAYCFAEIEGYSKFGSYTGNGSTDGTFIYTGFRPAFVIYKRTDSTNNWNMFDSKRDIDNQVGNVLYSNLGNAEQNDSLHSSGNDFLSNGFKLRETGGAINASGGTYIYMAFAENPFVDSTGRPVTAR